MPLKKFFKKVYKQIREELKEKPNNKIHIRIDLDFGGDTTANVEITTYDDVFIAETVKP